MKRGTPRRRISPRTVRRYRAIKNFVRRALGSSSQPDIKSNSSISVSVLELRQKIDGIEQQLNTVSKHCQDLATLESKLKLNNNLESEKESEIDTKKNKVTNTKILHKISQDRCDKPVSRRSTPKVRDDEAGIELFTTNKMLNQNYSSNYKEIRKNKLYHTLNLIEENEQRKRRRKKQISRTLPADLPLYYCHSFNETKNYNRHLNPGYSEVRRQRNRKKTEYFDTNEEFAKLNNDTEQTYGDYKNQRNKCLRPNLDQDFIADIIRRQYRPVKLFGRRDSDFSQFSAPVCRDQEFSIRETIQEGSDLCSCCHEKHRRSRQSKYMCINDLSDMRSICDTRLYSSKKHKHITNHKKNANDFYNDSTMYDIIPVKEKCSPKSRRKFTEDNMLMHDKYREVPPSPRTQRPRLNLQAQLQTEDDEDDVYLEKQLKHIKRMQQKSLMQTEGNFSKMSSEVFVHNKNFKNTQNLLLPNNPNPYTEECVGTTSNLQYPMLVHEQGVVNNDTTLNTQITDVSVDKTDKTLSEIKDILQNFLQEIKKESSQSEKLNKSHELEAPKNTNEIQQHIKTNSFNNNNSISNFGHCTLPSFMQSFPNSCCYPLLPVCPINCMQNGYVLPSPSFTCTACVNNSKERACGSTNIKNKDNTSEDVSNETQKLIKEIHNLISQNPNSIQKKDIGKNAETKSLITGNACGSKVLKHDAKVGTRILKCHSKSCEAIGSQDVTRTQYATNVSYSDTVLEKESGEEITTESVSETEYSSEPTVVNKKKENKFKNMLRSMGILKRNKSDVIAEVTESDSSIDVVKPKPRSPFQSHPTSPYQQHIINYNLHGQEYFHPPVMPHHKHQYECCTHHDPRACYRPVNMDRKLRNSQGRHYQEQDMLAHCSSPIHSPTMCANYYDPHCANVSPQVPVCLKEIEVKSIGTQSVRKISLLERLTNKMQVPVQQEKESSPKQSLTLTSSKNKNSKDKSESPLFDWRKIHEKAMQKTTDPLKFTYKTQKTLAEGDNTMRNAMLKKLFYKRNPFSPRNLLVRTLLGKDKSSFGEPPKMYKPKMFL